MKNKISLGLVLMLAGVITAAAADAPGAVTWRAQTLAQAVLNMLVFALLGIAVAVVGFKIFDKCTPGDLAKEILENKNMAAAIVGGAMILGICIIVAAAMIG